MTADDLPDHVHVVPDPPPGPLADLQRAYGRGMLTWQAAIDAVQERQGIDPAAAEDIVNGWDNGGWDY